MNELQQLRENMFAILDAHPHEASYVLLMLQQGKINGLTCNPEAECSCMFGTIGRKVGMRRGQIRSYSTNFMHGWRRPVEELFRSIRIGDTPETNPDSALAARLIIEWLELNPQYAKK